MNLAEIACNLGALLLDFTVIIHLQIRYPGENHD